MSQPGARERKGRKGGGVVRPRKESQCVARTNQRTTARALVTAVRQRTCAGEPVTRRVRPNPSIAWKTTRFPAPARPGQRESNGGGLSANAPAGQRQIGRAHI